MSLNELREIVKDREGWLLEIMESQSIGHDLPLNNKNKKNASGTKSRNKIVLKENNSTWSDADWRDQLF